MSHVLGGHEIMIAKVRAAIGLVASNANDDTNHLLVSDVLGRHEIQVWFLAEHLVDTRPGGPEAPAGYVRGPGRR